MPTADRRPGMVTCPECKLEVPIHREAAHTLRHILELLKQQGEKK